MQTYLKTRPVGIQFLLFIGMAFGIFLILSLIGMAVLSKMTGISIFQVQDVSRWDPNNPNMILYIRGMLLVQFFGLFVIPTLLFAYFSDPKPMDYIGLKPPSKHIYWVFAILALIVAIPFVDYMGYLNQKMFSGSAGGVMKRMEEEATKQIQFMLSKHTLKELFLNLFFIAVTAGVGEELLFRGVLQRLFIRATKSPWAGILIAAALFSASHFQFYGFIPRFLLGAVLGALYWYSGSLWTAILAHFFYDGFMIVLLYLNPEMIKNTDSTLMQQSQLQLIVSAMVSLAVTVFILWQMRKKSTASFEAVYRRDKEPLDDLSL
jgi:membrane protease YdiL (CAAX protease family)